MYLHVEAIQCVAVALHSDDTIPTSPSLLPSLLYSPFTPFPPLMQCLQEWPHLLQTWSEGDRQTREGHQIRF